MLTDLDYDLLSAYIDDALSESERTALELRLQAEPELRSELDELRATVTLLNNLPTLKAPRDFTLDARYARRSTFFFTSAAFTALSSAAAIILFALGAYLFAGRNNAQAPAASTSQEAQLALRVTSTIAATTLDKAAFLTPTEESLQNENAITETSSNSPVPSGGITANDAVAIPTSTALPSAFPAAPPLTEPDTAQSPGSLAINPTIAPTAGFLFGQQRTEDATETAFYDQYAAPSSAAGAVGAAAPSPFDQGDATGGEANTSSAFAATQLPMTATVVPTDTALPTLTLTSTATLTDTPQPTDTDTPAPTASRQAAQPLESAPDVLPLILVVLGVIFLLIAVISTVIRRRSRL